VTQCVLATLKRDELVFWTPHFFISGLYTVPFRLAHFGCTVTMVAALVVNSQYLDATPSGLLQ